MSAFVKSDIILNVMWNYSIKSKRRFEGVNIANLSFPEMIISSLIQYEAGGHVIITR